MFAALTLLLAQTPAIIAEGPGEAGIWTLKLRCLLPDGMVDPGFPVRLVSADERWPEEFIAWSEGRGDLEFRLLPYRACGGVRSPTWRLSLGNSEAPGLGQLELVSGWQIELVIDLRPWSFPILDRRQAPFAHHVAILDATREQTLAELEVPEYSFLPPGPSMPSAWPPASASIPRLPTLAALAPVPAGCYWLRSEAHYGASLPRLTPLVMSAGAHVLAPTDVGVTLRIVSEAAGHRTTVFLRRLSDDRNALPRPGRNRTWGTEDVSARLRWDTVAHGAIAFDLDGGDYEVLLVDPERGWAKRSVTLEEDSREIWIDPEGRCARASASLQVRGLGARLGLRLRLVSLEHACVYEVSWTPYRERIRWDGLPGGNWRAELVAGDGAVLAQGVAAVRRDRLRFELE